MQASIGGRCAPSVAGKRISTRVQNPYVRPASKSCRSAAVASAQTAPEDKWLARTVKEVPTPAGLATLRAESTAALATLRMPSTRNEDYRFTDITPVLRTNVQPAPAGAAVSKELVAKHALAGAVATVVVVDGVLRLELSSGLDALPGGVYVGPASGAPPAVVEKMGSLSRSRGGPFAVLNGALAPDCLVVSVGAGRELGPVHVLHLASAAPPAGDSAPASAPRSLVHLGPLSVGELVEEFVGLGPAADAGRYLTLGVTEVLLEQQAQMKHSYVQREATGAFHFKGTLVRQAERSQYSFVEAAVGGAIARHDLTIQQAGPETVTEMGHFLLCGPSQLHDLHSRLTLDHPHGTANQLHKCIVSHATGRGVFDGNVKVNQAAQKTDAGQLSRNLLLVPLATVNVKPNLQIIADDVKCTHGCAVSDLRDEELFYFRARGISAEAARQALVSSFGAEVVQRIGHPELVKRVREDVGRTLASVELFATATQA